jgi:hypothetical protein
MTSTDKGAHTMYDIAELTPEQIAALNSLRPYTSPKLPWPTAALAGSYATSSRKAINLLCDTGVLPKYVPGRGTTSHAWFEIHRALVEIVRAYPWED